MKNGIRLGLTFITLFWASVSSAQRWTTINPDQVVLTGQRDIIPQQYVVYNTDDIAIKEILWTAPAESSQPLSSSSTLITVGLADGSADIFRIVRYEMMEPGLSTQYPEIRTFRGESISNPRRTIRADWTEEGFRAVISDEEGMTFIDPFQRNDLANRIVYYKKDFSRTGEWSCGFVENESGFQEQSNQRFQGDCQFRTYRLAVATTGEYSNFFSATSAAQSGLVLSQVVTAVNRVNEVYEADLAVRLVLIENSDDVFYYIPASDPYSGDACNQLNQNQTTMTNVIGGANYDIGHVFSVGSGGCANLAALCSSTNKAKGATGLNPPTGDPFYIDYVAHELGHQFGGNHTFNGTAGSCAGNRVPAAAYEVGSGSTIMAYAGICGAQDVQPNSDAYFHAKSLQEIANVLSGTSCAAFLTFNNTAPVAAATPDYTIPVSTPFVLTANASDGNGDPLFYCWEQYDLEGTSTEPPSATDTDGPLFRSLLPVGSPSRYIPRLSDLVTNTNYTWEVLTSVTRTMTFRMTVRDYHNIGGCTDEDDVVISANAAAGPFTVTSQNTTLTWPVGSSQAITWNVANTTASPVNCANVDIKLSYDGGFTYPVNLLLNTPNDGSANITVPIGNSVDGRVMVKASNNIFFDINNADINIEGPDFTLQLNPNEVNECNDGSVMTTVEVGQLMGFTDPVTLSALNLPPGAIATFIPPIVIPGNNSTLTISNLGALFGTYTPTVRGTSTSGNKDSIFTINLYMAITSPTLLSPANNATNTDPLPLLDWSSVSGATQYEYQVASDMDFNSIVQSGTSATDQVQLTTPLAQLTTYFWRVRSQNPCGPSGWSSVFSFTTITCMSVMSTNVPINIPAMGSPIITSTLSFPTNLTITDINVINLMGTHSWVDDLKFTLIAPNATEVLIWDRPCGNHDDFNINFDDEAANSNWPCAPIDGLTYKPSNQMTPFDGLTSNGTWTMEVEDIANHDGGSLTSWGIRVCGVSACQLTVNQISGTGPGSLPAALGCAVNGDSIKLSASLAGQTINIGASPLLLNKNVIIHALAPNISITGTGTRIFDIPATFSPQLSGMVLKSGTSLTGGAISNSGTLIMKNVTTLKNPVIDGATLIQNSAGGQLFMIGNCFISL